MAGEEVVMVKRNGKSNLIKNVDEVVCKGTSGNYKCKILRPYQNVLEFSYVGNYIAKGGKTKISQLTDTLITDCGKKYDGYSTKGKGRVNFTRGRTIIHGRGYTTRERNSALTTLQVACGVKL